MKFKVGDKVMIRRDTFMDKATQYGVRLRGIRDRADIMTVCSLSPNGQYLLRTEDDPHPFPVAPCHITLAERGHPHAELMAQYAEDARTNDKPWKLWEFRERVGKNWHSVAVQPKWNVSFNYRRKSKTHTVNGFEVPASDPDGRFIPYPVSIDWYRSAVNISEETMEVAYSRNLTFATPQDAIANAKAMCSIDPTAGFGSPAAPCWADNQPEESK